MPNDEKPADRKAIAIVFHCNLPGFASDMIRDSKFGFLWVLGCFVISHLFSGLSIAGPMIYIWRGVRKWDSPDERGLRADYACAIYSSCVSAKASVRCFLSASDLMSPSDCRAVMV